MQDYAKHGFLYIGGGFLKAAPQMRHRPEPQFADHPYELDARGQASVAFSPETMEAITVQAVDILTAHGPVSLETLDRISYLVDEARLNHPDQVWNNEPVPLPRAVAEFLSTMDRTDPDNDFPEVPAPTDAPEEV